uniref:FAM69 protein-kinase domain-containing protein n=2 Tax=Tetranychus urticae TaxID=32264 RepID=T1KCC1_TETUR
MIDEDIKLTREETIQGIHAIITTDFEGTEIDPSYLTIPWFGSSVKLSSLTNKELNSLWTLAQDNEYIYSTFFGQLTQWNSVKLLPQVLGTCGHFYAVEYIPEAIQFFDVIPEKSSLHLFKSSFSKRLSISHMFLKFLYHLESGNYNLQLCDVKYDQFAMKNGTILLIDSDMLYPSEVVQESIQHIDSCIKDEDCDFIDCKGRCKPSKVGGTCDIDIDSDSNLKRICRNLFFIDEISTKDLVKSSSQINAGLLSHFPLSYQSDIYKLKQLCSGRIKESEMISTIKKMIDLTSAIQSRTYPLNG